MSEISKYETYQSSGNNGTETYFPLYLLHSVRPLWKSRAFADSKQSMLDIAPWFS